MLILKQTFKEFLSRPTSKRAVAKRVDCNSFFAFSYFVSFRLTKFIVMRHSIAACVLFLLSTLAHAQGAPLPCAMPPSDEWELLSSPPPESAQMLAITQQGAIQAADTPSQNDAWFHSKSGAYRYCRSTRPTDRCYAGSAYTDFQLRNGQWYVASAGSSANCPVPQKCAQSLQIQDTGSHPNAKNVTKGLARQVALKAIAENLSKEWSPPSTQIYMAISMRRHAGKDFLHFCFENTSTHSLELNDSTLPWKVPNLLRFVVLNASGTIVFTSSPIIDQMMGAPASRVVTPSDTIEGDLELARLRFYDAAASEDLLVMWRGPIGLYEETGPGRAELPVSGIMFVPKH